MVKTPTSATSPDRLHPPSPITAKRLQHGFTLIELLVVLAIAALLMSLAPVAYKKYRDSAQYSTTLRTVAADLRQARQSAMTRGVPASFVVDLVQRKYGVAGSTSHDLPESLQIKTIVGSKQIEGARVASIEFLPDGGASGGSIEVLRLNGGGTRLRVDWLSGQVTQERLTQ